MYYVYLLQSLKDNKYYIGYTKDIKERVQRHNNGEVKSTKSRRPLRLIGYEIFTNRDGARWYEYNLKHHSDKKEKFIQKLIR
jgi:putative endonuclease